MTYQDLINWASLDNKLFLKRKLKEASAEELIELRNSINEEINLKREEEVK